MLGITISQAYKDEAALAKKQKRKARFIPWDYARDSSGRPVGTLYNINKLTDLHVYARGIKHGRTCEEVEFLFTGEKFVDPEAVYTGFESVYIPNVLPKVPEPKTEETKGWVWVRLRPEQVQELLREYQIPNLDKLLALSSQSLQQRKDGVYRYMRMSSLTNDV